MARRRWSEPLLEVLGRNGLTIAILFVFILLALFPLRTEAFGDVRPALLTTAVFYWAVYRPYLLRAVGVFVAGVVFDLVTGLPPGVSALILLAVQGIASAQQKFLLAQSYVVVWACFSLLAFLAGLGQWAILSLLSFTVFTIKPTLVTALLTALLYPLVTFPLYILLQAMDKRELYK